MKVGRQIQAAGFYLSGLLCLALTVLKLTLGVPGSWWRVLLPIWVVLGHNALYVTVGFAWMSWIGRRDETEGTTARQSFRLTDELFECTGNGYERAAPSEAIGRTIDAGQKSKTEILVCRLLPDDRSKTGSGRYSRLSRRTRNPYLDRAARREELEMP